MSFTAWILPLNHMTVFATIYDSPKIITHLGLLFFSAVSTFVAKYTTVTARKSTSFLIVPRFPTVATGKNFPFLSTSSTLRSLPDRGVLPRARALYNIQRTYNCQATRKFHDPTMLFIILKLKLLAISVDRDLSEIRRFLHLTDESGWVSS